MEVYILSSVVVLIASAMQTATGFGFSVLATPFLLMLLHPVTAIQVNIIISIFISFVMLPEIKKECDSGMAFRMSSGAVFGGVGGVLLVISFAEETIRLYAGIVLLFSAALVCYKSKVKQTNRRDIATGTASGLLTTSLGMPGPPLLLYFASTNISKSILRSTTLIYFLFAYSASLIMHAVVVGVGLSSLFYALLLIPFSFFGIYIGKIIYKVLGQKVLKSINLLILVVTGVMLVLSVF